MSRMIRRAFRAFFKCEMLARMFVVLAGIFIMSTAFGEDVPQLTLTELNTSISKGVGSVVVIMQNVATITGIAFIFASFFKFHQHKMNPTQVPMSQGVTLLVIGAGLTVFPNLLNTASQGLFGQTITKAGEKGISTVVSTNPAT
ncbi:MAG: hypothetical protein A3J38_06215 [Gammaproteobacteria bacterium RIFCSPHIGHO2_12_FULL_45_9]|nr:MAG: hypothetical protein A3J38_06215 [Gammaproteobacteria bacterium RIFCSPHIGHO2_12_FULL_45_9]